MLVSKSRIPPTYPFGLTLNPSRARGIVSALALGTLIFLLLRPFLAIGHELLVVGLAGLLRSLSGASLWPALIGSLPLDPVYTLALVHFAGEIQARGVAVAVPVGGMLHTILPGLFTPPELVTGNWASAVLEPGSTVLAQGLASFGADLALLLAGLAIAAAGRGGRPWLVVCGALQQAHDALPI